MYNDFNSKKYIFLLIIICVVFVILIIKAFQYLPDNNENYDYGITAGNINNPAKITNNDEEDSEEPQKYIPEEKHGVLYKSYDSLGQENETNTDFEYIDAPKGAVEEEYTTSSGSDSSSTPEEQAIKHFLNAKNSVLNGDTTSALKEYQIAAENTDNKELTAECYEGIAEIYAKQKKYETALSFAGKSYNTQPSISREVLIAKIYYSAGKTDVAIRRINNLLKRGFDN